MEYTDVASGGVTISGSALVDKIDINTEVPEGGAMALGCATVEYIEGGATFAVGEVLYSKPDAIRYCTLRKVVIKEVRLFGDTYEPPDGVFQKPALYVDTENGYWNEWELVYYSEALELQQSCIDRKRTIFYRSPRCSGFNNS